MDIRRLGLRHQSLLDCLLNRADDSAVLAEGTAANTFKTTAVVGYSVKGQRYTKAATDNIAFAAATGADAFVVQPDLTTCYYLFLIDAAGNVVVVQGRDSSKAVAKGKPKPGEIPLVPSNNYAVIGVMKLVTNGGTFTPAVTDLSGAGITDTYANCGLIPAGGHADLTFA